MDNQNLLNKAKRIVLASDSFWVLKDMDEGVMILLYSKPEEKASCGTACCLGCFLMPLGIIYAILGGKKGVNKQVILEEKYEKIYLRGDAEYVIKVFHLLRKSEISNYVPEAENIRKIKKSMLMVNFFWVIVIILLFVLFFSSKNV